MTLSILHILGFLVATAVFLLFLAGCLWLFGYAVGRGVAIGFNHENEEEQTKNNQLFNTLLRSPLLLAGQGGFYEREDMAKKIKINWKNVWKNFEKWWGKNQWECCGWKDQTKAIQRIIEDEINDNYEF